MRRADSNAGVMTFAEIGRRLGVSEATARNDYRRGMYKLRRDSALRSLFFGESARVAGRRHMSALVQTWDESEGL